MTDLHIPPVSGAGAVARGRDNGGSAGFDDLVFNRLLRERIIFLGSEVTDESANRVVAQLLLLAAEDAERDITLYINSPGGSVYSGMAIYDTWRPWPWAWPPPWASCCCAPAPPASGTRCRTRGS
jgi:ATP-dependent Clp protease protease subunit